MKVLLIDPPWFSLQGMSHSPLPLGLAYVASSLKDKGHEALIFSGEIGFTKSIKIQKVVVDDDFMNNLEEKEVWKLVVRELKKVIGSFKPDLIGITMPTVKYEVVKALASAIKSSCEVPTAPIVVGGPHPTIMPEDTLKIEDIDYVVRGEGEETIIELIDCLEHNKTLNKVKGLSYRKGSKVINNTTRPYIKDLDDLPYPKWNLVHNYDKMNPSFFGNIISSRGCPYQCTFCASKKMWGTNTRFRSPGSLLREIIICKAEYGTTLFHFNDDSFTVRQENVKKFCKLLIEWKVDIQWTCDTRVNLVDYNLLKLMKEAGCIQVNFGVECGNDKMLKDIKKGITVDQVINAFNIAKLVGLSRMGYFMTGFPNETLDDMKDTIRLMNLVNPEHPCWSIVTPYPGTELYDTCLKEGLIPKDINWSTFHHHSKNMGFSKYIDKEEFHRIANKVEKTIFWKKMFYYMKHPVRLLKELKVI